MTTPSPLQEFEAQLLGLQTALASSDPLAVEQQAQAVRRATTLLADWLAHTPASQLPPEAVQRAQALGAQLAGTREQLARVLAITGQQASSLLPPVDHATYGPTGTSQARIYRAPG